MEKTRSPLSLDKYQAFFLTDINANESKYH